jgi:hypothetical protein
MSERPDPHWLAVLDHRRRAKRCDRASAASQARGVSQELSSAGPTALDGIDHSLKGMRPTVLDGNKASFDAELEASGVLDAASHPDFGLSTAALVAHELCRSASNAQVGL